MYVISKSNEIPKRPWYVSDNAKNNEDIKSLPV